jgi:hypothetical protein
MNIEWTWVIARLLNDFCEWFVNVSKEWFVSERKDWFMNENEEQFVSESEEWYVSECKEWFESKEQYLSDKQFVKDLWLINIEEQFVYFLWD